MEAVLSERLTEGEAKSAARYTTAAWAIFLSLCATAMLPDRLQLVEFALPFGFAAIAWYYPMHGTVADAKQGAAMTAVLVCLLGFWLVQARHSASSIAEDATRAACVGTLDDERAEERCQEVSAILHPSPSDHSSSY